ncbi:MAG: heparinase II/III family protein [Bacteroidales bacterium]|nr:heparinase II/III family protein [Bacteroidales bacterium]
MTAFLLSAALAALSPDPSAFSLLDLTRPGMEKVAEAVAAGNDDAAADALLAYFRSREASGSASEALSPITEEEQKWADDALEHRFFVHSGYQPSYFYGDDIDWTYWPVKDNELRWQLHRMKWWIPLGKAYRLTGDEKYAAEWVSEYLDWIEKNPLEGFDRERDSSMQEAPNVFFAWRPLEVSDRVERQIAQFTLMLPSESFTGAFLTRFLVNYHRHCVHLTGHFSATGNHLLFQAQRLLRASVFFPEFKDAASWRETSVGILSREISRQVYPDGMQNELDPHYHLEAVKLFADALGLVGDGVFPDSYRETVYKMIRIIYNYSYPDYANPMFSDFHGQHDMVPLYGKWRNLFPEDPMIEWLATGGASGKVPDYLSRAFSSSGFYCLRNGWTSDATVMVLKAGPPGFWHCQPDNGTFEYWRKGRNFFPDSGCYVYGGDAEILAMRNWFRQTSVHNTLTLNGKNLETTDSKLVSWLADSTGRASFTVENPSYPGFIHQRSVDFRPDGTVLIEDTASGDGEGVVAIHYNLLPCIPEEDFIHHRISTAFPDGNNISIEVMSPSYITMERKEGRVSYAYRHYEDRPAYAFSAFKRSGESVTFVTLIRPV